MKTMKILAMSIVGVMLAACDSGVELSNQEDSAAVPVVPSVTLDTVATIDATPAFIQRGCGNGNSEQVYCPD